MSNYKKVKKQSDNPFLNLYKLDAVDRREEKSLTIILYQEEMKNILN